MVILIQFFSSIENFSNLFLIISFICLLAFYIKFYYEDHSGQFNKSSIFNQQWKDIFSIEELMNYTFYTKITPHYFIQKEIQVPFQSWNAFQAEIIERDHDVIKIPWFQIREILIIPWHFNYRIDLRVDSSDYRITASKPKLSRTIYSLEMAPQNIDPFLVSIHKLQEIPENDLQKITIKFQNIWGTVK